MNLKLYTANPDYLDFLRKADSCVPYIKDENHARPFIGILLTIENMDYFAPLASPKPKHQSMKNQIDFIKINGGKWGVINLNNMIPIHPSCIVPINLKILMVDSKDERDYKYLLAEQLSWCISNRTTITSKAARLYAVITSQKARLELAERCCNFSVLEEHYRNYCALNGLDLT